MAESEDDQEAPPSDPSGAEPGADHPEVAPESEAPAAESAEAADTAEPDPDPNPVETERAPEPVEAEVADEVPVEAVRTAELVEPEPTPEPVEAEVADEVPVEVGAADVETTEATGAVGAEPVGIVARDDVDDGRDTADFTAVTAFLRRRGVLRPAPPEPILVPQRSGVLVPGAAPGATQHRPLPPRPEPDDLDQVNLSPLIEWARQRDPVRWTLFAMVAVWSIIFITLGYRRHAHFGTFGFDLGIYDQGIWLLSRFKDPFVTVRGLDLFGHHMNVGLLLFVPFYWLGAGPIFLLVAQVAAQASGAIAVFLLARDRLKARWPAVALSSIILLHPTYQFLVWEYFHPEVVAVAPLLFAYWAARAKRWRWFAVAAVLAMACKEDVALGFILMGIVIAVRGDRRVGAIVAAAAAAWFMAATRIFIPRFNGIGPFYDSFFGEFGRSPTQVVGHVVTHPGYTFDVATEPDRMNYYRMLFAPVAFLPVFALSTMLIALPMLGVNVLSTFPYQRDAKFHWSALVLAGIILATVEAIAWLGRTPTAKAFLVGLVVATSLASTVAWGPSPIGVKYHQGYWPFGPDPRLAPKEAAAALVPDDADVSAVYLFVPQLAHREKIYEFPNPWVVVNWGVDGENPDDPADVDWLVVDRQLLSDDDDVLIAGLLEREFVVRYDNLDIMAAERVAPPGPGSPNPSASPSP